jgi:hypothetical protein
VLQSAGSVVDKLFSQYFILESTITVDGMTPNTARERERAVLVRQTAMVRDLSLGRRLADLSPFERGRVHYEPLRVVCRGEREGGG